MQTRTLGANDLFLENQQKDKELGQELSNLLINLYNGKESKELKKQYRVVVLIVSICDPVH